MPTLVLIRHAKSDWSATRADRDRPLSARGQRQAVEAGRWLAQHGPTLDWAVVSPATRARVTWDLVAEELPDPPPAEIDEAAYTFDGEDLRDVVHALDDALGAVALVGHNPAMEELLRDLTGGWHAMPTSCVAVLEWSGPWTWPRDVSLVAHGRPPE